MLATLYLLAEEHSFSMPFLPDHAMWESNLARFTGVALLQSSYHGFADQTLISSLLCLAIGHGKETIARGSFLLFKDKAPSYLHQFKY